MTTWRISIDPWEWIGEADDEDEALEKADSAFSFMAEARTEEISPDGSDDAEAKTIP